MPSTKKRQYRRTTKTTTSKRRERQGKRQRQKGGIVIQPGMTAVQAMEYFLANCDRVTLFSSGSSGIIFRCTLRAGADSPYTSYRTGSFNRPITTVILKFVALTDDRQPGQPDRWYCEPERKNKNIEEVDSFRGEVNTQL